MKGLGVSNAQKQQLLKLSSQLHEYDRRPVTFEPRPYKCIRGRFGRSKRGPPSVDYMKRCVHVIRYVYNNLTAMYNIIG